MFGSHSDKIIKKGGREATAFEEKVAAEMFKLQSEGNSSIKSTIAKLKFLAAKEVEVPGSKPAIVIFVPFKMLTAYHAIQKQLVVELEKKFNGQHVVIIAQRTILPTSFNRGKNIQGPRPRSRTLTKVHESILEDVVYPTEIVGKRTRCKADGSKTLKVMLDPKEQMTAETKIDSFQHVYKKLTGKDVIFEFPVDE
eukprot:g2596.t1